MPLDTPCAAGCAGSASPPYPRGFSPALETETCSWCSGFLSAYAVDGFPALPVLSSLGRLVLVVRQAVIAGPFPAVWQGREGAGSGPMLSLVQSGPVGRCCYYLSTASPCWLNVTSRDPRALTLMCTFRARARTVRLRW